MNKIVKAIRFLFLLLLWPACAAAQQPDKWSTVEPDPLQSELKKPGKFVVSIDGTVLSQTDGKPIKGASVVVVGTNVKAVTNEHGRFSLSCPEGENMLRITSAGMKPVELKASSGMSIKLVPIVKLESPLLPSTCFYVQPSFQVGTLMAVGVAVGGYISNFNVEAFYMLGLAKSEDIYWTKSGSNTVTCSYKPTAFGLRAGYGLTLSDAWRLTPQVGLSAIGIKCNDGDSKGNAVAATLGVRAEYAVTPHVQLFAAPEVCFAVSKSNVFKQLEDVSSKIKGWGTSFNARLGVIVTF